MAAAQPGPARPAEPPLRELRGVAERITYSNPETGYAVVRLAPERRDGETRAAQGQADDRLVTVVGTLADVSPGEAIQARGWWKNDPKYGWQFVAVDYRTTLPATVQGMKKYLGSGLVKGVGPVNAGRIVDTFGEQTFEVIDETPERLTEVPGIGPVRAARIAATWAEQRHVREVMAALQSHGISTSLAARIYRRFGDESATVIAREPYRLAREVWGIGFKTADKIARAIGIAPDAPERLQAGLLHALGEAADAGNTLLPEPELITQACALLGVPPDGLADATAALLATGELIAAPLPGRAPGSQDRLIALAPFARAEAGLAARLRALAAPGTGATRPGRIFSQVDWPVAFRWLAERHGLRLAPEQEGAVRMALAAPVSLLTGGPGTGKCVVGDTQITLADGSLVCIRDTVERALAAGPRITCPDGWEAAPLQEPVLTYDTQTGTVRPAAEATGWRHPAPRVLVEVTTRTGDRLLVTPEHPFFTTCDGQLQPIRADELSPGTYVAAVRQTPVAGKEPDLLDLIAPSTRLCLRDVAAAAAQLIRRLPRGKAPSAGPDRDNASRLRARLRRLIAEGSALSIQEMLRLLDVTGVPRHALGTSLTLCVQRSPRRVRLSRCVGRDLVYLAGLVVGDGHIGPRTVELTSGIPAVRCVFFNLCVRLFGTPPRAVASEARCPSLRLANAAAYEILTIGFGIPVGRQAKRVRAPAWLFAAPVQLIGAYLAGLLDSDGTVVWSDQAREVQFWTSSAGLATDIKALLLRIGVRAHLRARQRDYLVTVHDSTGIAVLGSLLPLRHPERAATLKRLASRPPRPGSIDVIPALAVHFRSVWKASGLSQAEVAQRLGVTPRSFRRYLSGRRNPTRPRVLALSERIGISGNGTAATLGHLARQQVFWDRIERVRPVEGHGEAYVYDLTVPGSHTFLAGAGGVIVHNTTTLKAILALARAKGLRCLLAAPTGRAAKRMEEATGLPAATLHRLLELRPGGKAGRDRHNPLPADLVVVDETSMLDALLANQLVKAVAPGAHLLLVGDPDQLPSVGAGDVLADLLRVAQGPSAAFPVTRLQHIFRQGAGSGIALNARRINAGEMPRFGGAVQDCYFLTAETPQDAARAVVDLVARRLPARYGFRPGEVQVLSPMHRGEAGVGVLNTLLQERLNPARPGVPELRGGGRTYRPGDRILQLKNDYDLKVFNGDLGTVRQVDPEEAELHLLLDDGREVRYPAANLHALTHAFAVTVHKCVRGDERVWTATRGLIPIRDVRAGEEVVTGDCSPRRVVAKVPTGRRRVVRVTTRLGYRIDVSEEHPILVADSGLPRFVRAGELTTDHYACLGRQPVEAAAPVALPVVDRTANCRALRLPQYLDDDLAWLLGVLVGDGSYRDKRDGTIDVTNQDPEVLANCRRILEGYGLRVGAYRPPSRRATRLYAVSHAFRRCLQQVGLHYVTANDKRVPDLLFRAPASQRAAFLRGLFDTDGCAGKGVARSCRLVTSSPRLASDVQQLLLTLGIISYVSQMTERAYCLAVSDRTKNVDHIPFSRLLMGETVKALTHFWGKTKGIKGRGIFSQVGLRPGRRTRLGQMHDMVLRSGRRLSYRNLMEIVDYLERVGAPVPELIRQVQRTHYFYDQIKKVEFTDEADEMYDVEVDGIHSFIANGFVCHNSQGAEFPAVVIPLLTSHAAMLGRTLLYTAVTRARRLVVIVGQWKALSLAVNDWRREPRYTALQGLLEGTVAFRWPESPPAGQARGRRATGAAPDEADLADLDPWEGLLAGAPES